MSPGATNVKIVVSRLSLPMRTSFKHAAANRTVTDSIWVEASRGGVRGLGEGCPRSYVTGERTESALLWLETVRPVLEAEITDIVALTAWIAEQRDALDVNPAAWCAVELALLDLFAREQNGTVEALLGLPPIQGPFHYSAVVGDESPEKLAQIVGTYVEYGFTDYKFKIGASLSIDGPKFALLEERLEARGLREKLRLRLDANNLWAKNPQDAFTYLAALGRPLLGVEEAFAPRDWNELSRLSLETNTANILDESCARLQDVETAGRLPGRWIGNVRVSKMGGLLRSLEVVRALAAQNLFVIVGAQVGESSILTRAALTVAQAAGPALLAQEGAFGNLLLAEDPVTPALQFGKAGELQVDPIRGRPGWGLSKAEERFLPTEMTDDTTAPPTRP